MIDLTALSKQLGFDFKNPDLFAQAFTHRSYLNEHPEVKGHNERLEFLGDAVVELIVTIFLYDRFPEKSEGELTSLRAALVRRNTLSEIGQELDFDQYLQMSRGEAKNIGKARNIILSNAAESFIGALYLDQGLARVQDFLGKYLLPKLEKIIETEEHVDAKSKFQELVQERDGVTPHYLVETSSGPDHNRQFIVGVYIGETQIATGEGSSKREAEMAAATKALESL